MDVSFKLNARDLQKKLQSIQNGYEHFERPLQQVKGYQLQEINKQFASQGSNITSAWKPLSARTIAQRIHAGFGAGPILQRTGKLKSSFRQTKLNKNELNIGSNSRYFQFHQLGGKRLPQRQMIGHSHAMVNKVIDIFARYINQLILHG